jgi:hypothetical protein
LIRLQQEATLHVEQMLDEMEPTLLPHNNGQIWIFVVDEHGIITIFQGHEVAGWTQNTAAQE